MIRRTETEPTVSNSKGSIEFSDTRVGEWTEAHESG